MQRIAIGLKQATSNSLFAVSTGGAGDESLCLNQLHQFEDSAWSVVAEWRGVELADFSVIGDVVVCAGNYRSLYLIRGTEVVELEVPDRDRSLGPIVSRAGGALIGGSRGHYLEYHTNGDRLEQRNLSELGLDKPGRDIECAAVTSRGVVLGGSNQLLILLSGGGATPLLPSGPTNGPIRFTAVAEHGGTIYVGGYDGLIPLLAAVEEGELLRIPVLPESYSGVGPLASLSSSLLVASHHIVTINGSPATTLHRFTEYEEMAVGLAYHHEQLVALSCYGAFLTVAQESRDLPSLFKGHGVT